MPITHDKKQAIASELSELLGGAKSTVYAKYDGLSVAQLQTLRRAAREKHVAIKVVKNRLVRVAMQQTANLKQADTGVLKGQLLYAISSEDEVAPAQALAAFAKTNESLKLAGGITADGLVLGEADVKALAALPTKDQLRGQLVGTIAAPLSGFVNVLAGNVRGVMNVLNARAKVIS
jgi:large subunit ribosomal protein L10